MKNMNNSIINEGGASTFQQELLTILIPTKDRPYLLNRSLHYYVQAGILTKIIIVDSSNSALSKKTKEICDRYSDRLDIDYSYVDTDMEISNKLYIAADRVNTPYLLSIGDDDFPLKSTIEEILCNLEKDKTIVAGFGQRVALMQITSKKSGFKWVKSYPNYGGVSITNNSALDRIRRLPIPIWQQYPNAIFRTNPFKKAWQTVRKLEHTQYAEFFAFSLILAHGKWLKYDMLLAVCHQESKFCSFKDRGLFPSYIGTGGSVMSGISQKSWSKVVSSLCYKTACEFVDKNDSLGDIEDVAYEIRSIYYSKLVHYLEYNNNLSDNLIDSNSVFLRRMNGMLRKFSKFYWMFVLYDKSGGIHEFINFILGLGREILNGRFFKMMYKSKTDTNIIGLLSSIKRTGSLKYESDSLMHISSKYSKEYQIIFNVWTNDPCPQRLKE
jgi:glycosyltransferase domain-containing protein